MATGKRRKLGMSGKTARFKELKPSTQAFIDTRLPEHQREIYNVIGRGVTEDKSLTPAISDADDFNITYIKASPGKGAALHAHPTVEVFIPLSGQWTIYMGENGDEEIELAKWDVVSVPPGLMRGFRNSGKEDAHLMAILGGTNSGHVSWHAEILKRAEATGLELDADGSLIDRLPLSDTGTLSS